MVRNRNNIKPIAVDTLVKTEATESKKFDDFVFSKEEGEALKEIFAILSGKQIRAARLDASGLDAITIASTVKVSPPTISSWRNNPDYTKARNLFVSIINKQGLKFRLDCQRQILAPAYAELMRRTANPHFMHSTDIKNVLDIVKTIGKETRLDSVGTGESEDTGELQELQERRKNFSYARQAQAIEELKKQDKLISFGAQANAG